MEEILLFLQKYAGNAEYSLILVFIFLTTVLCVAGLGLLLIKPDQPSKRLNRLLGGRLAGQASRSRLMEAEDTGLVARVATPMQAMLDSGKGKSEGRSRLRLMLAQAGFRSQKAYRNLLAIKGLLTVLLPVLFLVRTMFFSFALDIILICMGLALFGFFAPNVVIYVIKQKRQLGIMRALPDALDLMVICVEAGLGLDMTFKKVGDEIQPINTALSDELHLVNREVRAGLPRDESLKNLAIRTGVGEVQNLVTMLIQTHRFGTSLAKSLRVHSDAMRIKRRQYAEERAAKAAVKLVLPLILCIFPGIMVVLAGPAALKIVRVLFPAMSGQ